MMRKLNLIFSNKELKKAVAAELEKTPEVITSTGLFSNIDKLYGSKSAPAAGQEPDGEVTEPSDTGFETGIEETPPTDFGAEFGGGTETPEAGGAEVTPESFRKNDLNLVLEENDITGRQTLDLSKGKKSLQEIEGKLNELLNN